jgi:DoxX
MNENFSDIYWPLRAVYGLVPLLAGLDKFTNILADWAHYVSPFAASLLPMSVGSFMHVVGVIEVIVGLVVLFGWTRIGALVAAVWLVAIALELLTGGFLDIAVRDVAMAVGAYTLAQVAARRGEEFVPHLAAHETHAARV